MKAIMGLIVGAIGVFIVVSLIKPVTDAAKTITDAVTTITTTNVLGTTGTTTTPAYSSGLQSMAGILPFVFAAMILLVVVRVVGDGGFGLLDFSGWFHREKVDKSTYDATNMPTVRTNSAHTISVVEKASAVLLQYQNDLEGILGIKTAVDNHKYFGLDLTGSTLAINDEDYDWYITAKQKDENTFKVVGLNKIDASNNVVYVLGTRESSIGMKPFLIKVPVTRVDTEIKTPQKMALED